MLTQLYKKTFSSLIQVNLCVWRGPSDSSWWEKVLLDESGRLIGPLLSWMNWLWIRKEELDYDLADAALTDKGMQS